jgi:hypothetical protein
VPDLNGFKTEIDTVNSKGGVNGHRIDLNTQDTAYDVTKGQVEYTGAVSSGTRGVFGGVESVVWVPRTLRAQQERGDGYWPNPALPKAAVRRSTLKARTECGSSARSGLGAGRP